MLNRFSAPAAAAVGSFLLAGSALTSVQPDGLDDHVDKAPMPFHCQSACKFDPSSASNFDPFVRRDLTVALVSSKLAEVAETRRARVR
jgi:hypothetical protein